MKKIAFLLICLLLSFPAFTQNASNPVQVTSNLTPPYSLYLSDYSDAGQNKWNIQLLLKDFTKTNYQAKLRITIEGAGIRLRTRHGYSAGPIRLDPGIPYQVDATDLGHYLNIQNMEVSGINRNQLASSQKLPEGFYQFKIEILDYNRNNRVSNTGTSMAWLVLNDPPLLNLPFEEKLRLQDPQQVQFQWTPRHTSSPNSAFETEYIFRLWEIWPEGRDPNEVARTTQPLFERTIMTTSYFYGLNDAMLIPGRSYAWQVQAVNLNGRDLFKNQGKSEVRWFKYGDECLPISNLGAEALGTDRIRITWEGKWNHNQYVAQIRKTGDEEWTNYGTNIETQVIYDLEANTEYQIRVLPSCGAIDGTAENTLTLSTPEQDLEDFDCGAEADLPTIENREPIAELKVGDRITAAGFTVILTEVIKTGDTYTGMGLIEVPLFNSARVEAMLNDIEVNTDKQLIGGNVESTLNPNGPFILDTDSDEELSEEGGDGEDNNEEEEDIDDLPDTDIDIEGEIADVEYDGEEDTIIITDPDGNTTEIDSETADENEDGDIVIEDDNGDVWVVDEDGEVSGPHNSGGGAVGDEENVQDSLNIQEELVKEVLAYYKEEINLWIENYEKGPLDESTINRLSDFPDCLPEDVDELDAILVKINEYIEDPKSLLDLIQEDDLRRTKMENFSAKLTGTQPPYASGLSDEEWGELVEIVCPYLVEEEEQGQYTLPLTVYLDDDYFLINPNKTEFSKGDTITIESYMTEVTLFLKDAEGQSVELLSSHFPDNAGEAWPPGFTVNIEDFKEGETETVKILISEVDTFLVYIEKYKPELKMGQSDILAFLSDINETQKDDNTTCDVSERLKSFDSGDIYGDLDKVKVNGKYELQSLKLKLTNQGNTEISLEDVNITIREGANKEKEIAVFTFSGTADGETILELTVEKKDREFLEWYLLAKKPVFKITTTHETDDDYATVSSFSINRGTFSGYFLERPAGTAIQERTTGSYKRIPEGDYRMCYTYKECRAATTRGNADNETWIKTNGETDDTGATITREYVLIHIGNFPWNSAGCLLIGDSYSDHTLDEEIKEDETGITYEEDLDVKMVSSSGTKLTALNSEYKKLIDLSKKFDDDCENNKCYELEIDINR